MDNNQSNEQQTQVEDNVCPKCGAAVSVDQAYCTECGEPLKEGLTKTEPPSSQGLMSSQEEEEQRKRFKHARVAIMVVAIVTILYSLFLWLQLEAEIAKIEADYTMMLNQEAVTENRLIVGASFAIGFLFIILFFWAKSNPFGAALTALIIYITNIIVSVGIDPTNLIRGIVVKILIIFALVNGVRSGLAYKKLRENPGAD